MDYLAYDDDVCACLGRLILQQCHDLIDGKVPGVRVVVPISLHNGATSEIVVEMPYWIKPNHDGVEYRTYASTAPKSKVKAEQKPKLKRPKK